MTGFDLGDPAPDADDTDDGAGQDEQAEEKREPEGEPEAPTTEERRPPDPEPMEPTQPVTDSRDRPQQNAPAESSEDLSGPAFDYSEVRQRPLYARDETWDRFEDEVGITIVPGLRTNQIRDEETRELHDAALEVAIRHSDELLEVFLERRRNS